MNWVMFAWTAVTSVLGGFIGGWFVAFRIGSWRGAFEARLAAAEERLKRGDTPVGQVPILASKVEIIIEELRSLRREMREDRAQLVDREECDRRHGK